MKCSTAKGDNHCSLTSREAALLSPTANRITQKVQRLSPVGRAAAIEYILLAVLDEHGVNDPLNLLEFVFGERIEQQENIGNERLLIKQPA